MITRGASVGDIGQKRPSGICLESATYDCFGLVRKGRNGFDSRYTAGRSIRRTLIACVSTRRSVKVSLADVLVWPRDSPARHRSHPPNCPPTFPFGRILRGQRTTHQAPPAIEAETEHPSGIRRTKGLQIELRGGSWHSIHAVYRSNQFLSCSSHPRKRDGFAIVWRALCVCAALSSVTAVVVIAIK